MTPPCRRLRWKGRHGLGPLTPAAWAEIAARNETPWTCLGTTYPWGPDEAPVDPYRCTPDRPCFVPEPADPTRS